MFSNSEFAAFTGCPEDLSPEVAKFALFTIELDKVIDPETGEPFTPNSRATAYDIRPWTEKTLAGLSNATRKKDEAKRREDNLARQKRVDEWAKRGYALDPRALTDPHGGVEADAANVVDKSDDEWADFWGGASPTEMIETH